jgi:sporulation protein YlmC with PRC-barrel domain
MQRNLISVAVLGFALGTLPSFAQSPAPSGDEQQVAMSNKFLTQLKEGQWRGSKFSGLSVYNSNSEKIGSIEDFLIDESGKIDAVVIGIGGFLGIGKHEVAVPFAEVKFVKDPIPPAIIGPRGGSPTTSSAGGVNNSDQSDVTGSLPPAPRVAKTAYDYPDHAEVSMSKEQLNAAPQFKYALNE